MVEPQGEGRLDGGWWPQSRDLTVELADLVDHFPAHVGTISRVLVSPPDWDASPDRVRATSGHVEVGSFPHDDTHVVGLTLTDHRLLRVLVVPADISAGRGEEALLAAATPGNTHSAASILETVHESEDVDPNDQWNDEGGSWWGPNAIAPSFRTERQSPSR